MVQSAWAVLCSLMEKASPAVTVGGSFTSTTFTVTLPDTVWGVGAAVSVTTTANVYVPKRRKKDTYNLY